MKIIPTIFEECEIRHFYEEQQWPFIPVLRRLGHSEEKIHTL
jgi:hypothetical protein